MILIQVVVNFRLSFNHRYLFIFKFFTILNTIHFNIYFWDQMNIDYNSFLSRQFYL